MRAKRGPRPAEGEEAEGEEAEALSYARHGCQERVFSFKRSFDNNKEDVDREQVMYKTYFFVKMYEYAAMIRCDLRICELLQSIRKHVYAQQPPVRLLSHASLSPVGFTALSARVLALPPLVHACIRPFSPALTAPQRRNAPRWAH